MMQLSFSGVSYVHPDGENLFSNISFSLSKKITALVGNNGSGKSTMFKLINNELEPSSGSIIKPGDIYVLPQNLDIYSEFMLKEILGVDKKLTALQKITDGNSTIKDYEILDNDWTLENDLKKILEKISFSFDDLDRKLKTFSGGEITKIFLSSLLTRKPDLVLLDEPTNNLDISSREFLYEFIKSYKGNVFMISHDVELLNLAQEIIEIHNGQVKTYGGNYDLFFTERKNEKERLEKEFEKNSLNLKQLEMKKNEKIEKLNKQNNRGKRDGIKAGLPKMVINARKQNSENNFASKKKESEQKISLTKEKLNDVKNKLYNDRIVKIDMSNNNSVSTKLLARFENFNPNYGYDLWTENLDFDLFTNQKILISGNNGSGKTSLVKSLTTDKITYSGSIKKYFRKAALLNQNFLHLDENLTLFETIRNSCPPTISEHEIRIRLGRFLFYGDEAFKKVKHLSGGEKVRISLLKLLMEDHPEILILDEPTNNLDLLGIDQLITAVKSFNGCLIVISHDKYFCKNLTFTHILQINKNSKHKLIII